MIPTKFLFDTLYKTLNMNEQQNKETEEIVAQNPQIYLLQRSSTEYNENFSFGCDSKDTFHSQNHQYLIGKGYTNEGYEEEFVDNTVRLVPSHLLYYIKRFTELLLDFSLGSTLYIFYP